MTASAKVTFTEMERFALNEASRIETTQAALVRFGDIPHPHPDAMRNKEICEAIVRLVTVCRTEGVMAALKRVDKVSA